MKTVTDYNKKILGFSLKGRKPKTEKPAQFDGLFCFYCDQDDYNENKSFVSKVLTAAKSDQSIVVFNHSDTKNYKETFVFGLESEGVGFKSFSELSQDNEQKKKLWKELKKRI